MRQAEARTDGEFGTGLRARLELVRSQDREAEYLGTVLEFHRTSRRDFSPELALVSPDLSLGGLLLEVEAARDAPLGVLLAEAGLLDEAELVSADEVLRLVAAQRGLPFLDVRTIPVDPAAAKLLPIGLARANRALAVGFARGLPVVAVADPTDDDAMHGARSFLHSARFIASPEEAILFQLGRVSLS
jgi:hypothetical protein